MKNNCVVFGPDLADLYDDTRPFLAPNETSSVLTDVCNKLAMQFPSDDEINLLEVGAGTGRLTTAIARHYHQHCERIGTKQPHLNITCIDLSSAMLEKLKTKLNSFRSAHVSITVSEPTDIRDLQGHSGQFDAVVAHWLFHIISDWRVAVYVIESTLKPRSLIFLFQEESALYQALDGDFRAIQNDRSVLRLWSTFHERRKDIAKRLAGFGPILPPRSRLGSRVIDDRIDAMLNALGWSQRQNCGASDRWTYAFTLGEVIEKIIRPRAFTNMRLFVDNDGASKEFNDLAGYLKNQSSERELESHRWPLDTRFSARVFERTTSECLSNTTSSILLHVARDTLGRRWRRSLDHTDNRDALWRRLFARTWHRLNQGKDGQGPLAGVQVVGSGEVLGIFAAVPFADVQPVVVPSSQRHELIWGNPKSTWSILAGQIESAEPFALVFATRLPQHQRTQAASRSALDNIRGSLIHPHVHMLLMDESVEGQLTLLLDSIMNKNDPYDTAYKLLYNVALRSLLEDATRIGALPFQNSEAEVDFLIGLAKVASDTQIAAMYIFPFRADYRDKPSEVLGFMVAASQLLTTGFAEFLWALADVICNEYLEDVLFEREVGTPSGTFRPAIAKARTTTRTPVPPEQWRNSSPPSVLLVTAADVEFWTVIELAGIADQLEERRVSAGTEQFFELGFANLPVWVTQCRPGSVGVDAAATAVTRALTKYPPIAVIGIGIAFGLRSPLKQAFGDVLVSKQIQLYEIQKRLPPLKVIPRGSKPDADDFLYRELRACQHDWQRTVATIERPEVQFGLILTGDKLVNDPDFREELLKMEPEAIGGEMEAAGIYSAAQGQMTRWIIVKAVCDRGMFKDDDYQPIAAKNAVDFVFHLLSRKGFSNAINELRPPARG